MEDLSIYESRNHNVSVRDKPKVVGMAKGKMKVSGRKTLADISNVSSRLTASRQDNKSQPCSDAIRKIIEKLQTENAALKTLLSEKDKIIELGGAEVQKLRVNLQKVKQQNQQLAQSNCQILAELNSFKEMQKALKHELGCKNGVIIAKTLEMVEKLKATTCQGYGSNTDNVAETEETEVCTVPETDDDKDYNTDRRKKIKGLIPSARKIQVNNSSSVPASSKEEAVEGDSVQDQKSQEFRKTSLSRPPREAAKKVKSYKEISLNVKMRRDWVVESWTGGGKEIELPIIPIFEFETPYTRSLSFPKRLYSILLAAFIRRVVKAK